MRNELTGKQLIQQAAEGLSALLRGWAEAIFGLPVQRPALGALTWADLIILGCFLAIALLLHGAAAAFLRRKIRQVGEGTGADREEGRRRQAHDREEGSIHGPGIVKAAWQRERRRSILQ